MTKSFPTRPRSRSRTGANRPAPREARRPPPGPELDLTIEALGAQGDGVAVVEGGPVFVPFAAPGDRVRVRLGAPRGQGREAALLEVLAAGPQRAEPPCPQFGACGGCLLQHLAEAPYRDWKREQVIRALVRAGFEDSALRQAQVTALATTPPASRRRLALTARKGRDRLFLGFNERRSNHLVDIEQCPVARPDLIALLPPLRTVLATLLAERETVDLALTLLDDGVDLLIQADRAPDLPAREALAAFAETHDLARLSWQTGRAAAEPVAHRRPGQMRFGSVAVTLPPGGFLQASQEGEAHLVGRVLEAVGEARRVADLFCGAGTFTLPLATSRPGRTVLAADGDGPAVAALEAAAHSTGLAPFVRVSRRNLARDPLDGAELDGLEAVVFDPPRVGAAPQAAGLAASAVPVVVAVSCHPSSFARDAALLRDGGYRLDWLAPVDQFLWSPHIELVARFSRN